MDIARMLNVTILACLLILTGCFGLFDDGDVIDDADGESTPDDEETSEGSGSGSTTIVNNHYYNTTYYNNTSATPVMNTYPSVQSVIGNGTASFNTSAGEYVELLSAWRGYSWGAYWYSLAPHGSLSTGTVSFSCNTISGTTLATSWEESDSFLPSDGGPCNYSFTAPASNGAEMSINIIYRVWS
jgi:hypothetical protein